MTWAKRIENLVAIHGSQERLARALGVSFATVNRWINQAQEPLDAHREKVERLERKHEKSPRQK
jgi:transposase-like protein